MMLINPYTYSTGPTLPVVTWNSSDMASELVLSGSNLTVTRTSGSSPWRVVRATYGHTTGKRYFEVIVNEPGSQGVELGIASAAFVITGAIDNSAEAWAIYSPSGAVYHAGGIVGSNLGAITATQRGMLALDYDAGKAWVGRQGTFSGDPALGTGERFIFTPNTQMFPAAACYNDLDSLTGVFRSSSFAYSPPAGFGAYGG